MLATDSPKVGENQFKALLLPSSRLHLKREFKAIKLFATHRLPGRKKLEQSVTCFDAPTAVAAIFMAMAAIDAGTFARDRVATEKFWRLRGRSSDALATGNGTDPEPRRRVSQDHSGRASRTQSARRARQPE